MQKKIALKGLAGLVSAAIAVALSVSAVPASAAPTKSLTIANSAGMQSWDTTEADTGLLIQYYQPVFDSLIRQKPDGSFAPFLATKFTYNDEMTQLTLKLRTDVKFTDGTKFNATVAKANLDHQLAGHGPNSGRVGAIDSVVAKDSSTLVINLKTQDPGLLDVLSTSVGMMASPTSLKSATLKTKPVGSGPYILDLSKSVAGSTYVYKLNPNYWNKPIQKFKSITIKTMTDMVPRMNALKSGQVQGAPLDIGQLAEAKTVKGLKLQTKMDDFGGIQLIDRDGKVVKALGDLRVRQAINYAMDQKSLIAAFRPNGTGQESNQIFSKSGKAYVASLDKAYSYDLAKAKSLMAAAGYADGFTVTVPDMSGNFGADLYAAVIEMLGAIKIKVNLEKGLAFPDMIGNIMGGKYGMLIAGGPINSDWFQAANFYGPGFFNPLHSSDPKIDAYLNVIASTDGAAQAAAYKALNRYVVSQAWFALFFRDSSLYANTSAIKVQVQYANIVPFIYNYSPVK